MDERTGRALAEEAVERSRRMYRRVLAGWMMDYVAFRTRRPLGSGHAGGVEQAFVAGRRAGTVGRRRATPSIDGALEV